MEVHIWGSWYHDELPFGDPTAVRFDLSFHDDIPAEENPYGDYSMPGELLWLCEPPFTLGTVSIDLLEGWLEPPDYYDDPGADTICFEYIFDLTECPPFYQQGTVEEPVIYWLDVQADPLDDDEPVPSFGWKTSITHWNDDAAWINGIEPQLPIGSQGIPQWFDLHYPLGHPWYPETIDLAFAIYGIADSDGDGIPDDVDNCPDTPNPGQEDNYPPDGNNCGDACECEGDFDGNGSVGGNDVDLFKANMGRNQWDRPCSICIGGPNDGKFCQHDADCPGGECAPDPLDPCYGDFNCDGSVGGGDVDLFKADMGRNPWDRPCPDCSGVICSYD